MYPLSSTQITISYYSESKQMSGDITTKPSMLWNPHSALRIFCILHGTVTVWQQCALKLSRLYINAVSVYINSSKVQFLLNVFPSLVIIVWTCGWSVCTSEAALRFFVVTGCGCLLLETALLFTAVTVIDLSSGRLTIVKLYFSF